MEERRVWLGLQIDIEQGDDSLEALRVDYRPLLQRKGRSIEDERKMRRAPERRPILDLDRDRVALLGDAQDPCVAGHINMVGKEKLERRLADEIFVLRVELPVDDGDAAAVGHDLEAWRISIFEPHVAGADQAQLSLGAPSVWPDLNKVGGHDPRRIEPGVGALHGFGGGNRRRGGGLRRFGGLLRRRCWLQIKRRLLRESGGASDNGGQKQKPGPRKRLATK